jgi:hypothetical protein
VDENGHILDATKVRHVTIKAGKIESLSGLIDPASHLNLDYPDHRVTTCVIAENFSVGAQIQFSEQGLAFATIDPSSYNHYGFVDYTQRLSDMIEAIKYKRNSNMNESDSVKTKE